MIEIFQRFFAVLFLFLCIFALFLFSDILHMEDWIILRDEAVVKVKEQMMLLTLEQNK